MPDISARLDRLTLRVRGLAAKLRPRHVATVLALAVLVVGAVAVRGIAMPGPRALTDNERLQIQVVAPREPDVTPGAVMEVGDLVDGFEGVPPPLPALEVAAYAPWDDEPGKPDRRAYSKPRTDDAVIHAPPQPEASDPGWRDGPVGRWFGFDTPGPDYRAEREARRARLDARMGRNRDGREVRRYRSDGESMGGLPDRN